MLKTKIVVIKNKAIKVMVAINSIKLSLMSQPIIN